MTIKEVEQQTGLKRSNIRFYEQEKLISPVRNEKNGYREYSQEDVKSIQRIAYLRTLGFSIEEIMKIIRHQTPLKAAIKSKSKKLTMQLQELEQAKQLCMLMEQDESLDYDNLDIEKYVNNRPGYWQKNQKILKEDSVKFIILWGGQFIWGILTILCLLIVMFAFPVLPPQIPVQWSHGRAAAEAGKAFLFIYPLICLAIRFLLQPFIWRWLNLRKMDKEGVADYVTNFLCFVCLSVEVFTILFAFEVLSQITLILFADAAVFLGVLLIGWNRLKPS